ncbi:hypothetical protein WMY93_004515 [Mugilogobius chulae]|uniref:Reverse transcriptase domain-containing protein n=1 Tax=Mugilogobius chulae TaxID=88201 RepID=A0AAW0PX80_9GOBI
MVVSLDAEKAFDRLEWKFMFEVMEKFGLGHSFIQWVKLLYVSPKAVVLSNGISSHPFTLERGTRQGCPLSPLLDQSHYFSVLLTKPRSKRWVFHLFVPRAGVT